MGREGLGRVLVHLMHWKHVYKKHQNKMEGLENSGCSIFLPSTFWETLTSTVFLLYLIFPLKWLQLKKHAVSKNVL